MVTGQGNGYSEKKEILKKNHTEWFLISFYELKMGIDYLAKEFIP